MTEFLEQLVSWRRSKSAAWRRKNKAMSRRGMTWLYPAAMERRLLRIVRGAVKPLMDDAIAEIAERLPGWIAKWGPVRVDSLSEDLQGFNSSLRESERARFEGGNGGELNSAILGVGQGVEEFNTQQFDKFAKQATGMPFLVGEPWLGDVLEEWKGINYGLIRNLADDGIRKVNAAVQEGVLGGKSYREIMAEVRKVGDNIGGPRARLIARDQVGKLNGRLTEKRMTEAGIATYEWSTSLDERVRGNPGGRYPGSIPSHWIMEGVVCRWDNPAVMRVDGEWVPRGGDMPTEHAGFPIQCRCSSLPLFDEMIAEADARIDGAPEEGAVPAAPQPTKKSVADGIVASGFREASLGVLGKPEHLELADAQMRQVKSLTERYAYDDNRIGKFVVVNRPTSSTSGVLKTEWPVAGGKWKIGTRLSQKDAAASKRLLQVNVGHLPGFPGFASVKRSHLDGWHPPIAEANLGIGTVTHEMAHLLSTVSAERMNVLKGRPDLASKHSAFWSELYAIRNRYNAEMAVRRQQVVDGGAKFGSAEYREQMKVFQVSRYAHTNADEFFAEAFSEFELSDAPRSWAKEVGELARKHFGKGMP